MSPALPIIYATQTGISQEFAESLGETGPDQLEAAHLNPVPPLEVKEISSLPNPKQFLIQQRVIIFICSSFGDGDPPDSAFDFYDWLSSEENVSLLRGLKFALLGLGDRNYEGFQGFPKKLEKELTRLGAELFYHRGECDNSEDIDADFEAWKNGGLWEELARNWREFGLLGPLESAAAVKAAESSPQAKQNIQSGEAPTSSTPTSPQNKSRPLSSCCGLPPKEKPSTSFPPKVADSVVAEQGPGNGSTTNAGTTTSSVEGDAKNIVRENSVHVDVTEEGRGGPGKQEAAALDTSKLSPAEREFCGNLKRLADWASLTCTRGTPAELTVDRTTALVGNPDQEGSVGWTLPFQKAYRAPIDTTKRRIVHVEFVKDSHLSQLQLPIGDNLEILAATSDQRLIEIVGKLFFLLALANFSDTLETACSADALGFSYDAWAADVKRRLSSDESTRDFQEIYCLSAVPVKEIEAFLAVPLREMVAWIRSTHTEICVTLADALECYILQAEANLALRVRTVGDILRNVLALEHFYHSSGLDEDWLRKPIALDELLKKTQSGCVLAEELVARISGMPGIVGSLGKLYPSSRRDASHVEQDKSVSSTLTLEPLFSTVFLVLLSNATVVRPRPYTLVKRSGLCVTHTSHGEASTFLCHFTAKHSKVVAKRLHSPLSLSKEITKYKGNPPPIVMVGTGAGLGVFAGYLEAWQSEASSFGERILFAGSRNMRELPYRDIFMNDELVTKRFLALSRDGPKRIYVQDLIKEQLSLLSNVLGNQGGYLYFCGEQGMINETIKILKANVPDMDKVFAEGRVVSEKWSLKAAGGGSHTHGEQETSVGRGGSGESPQVQNQRRRSSTKELLCSTKSDLV